MRYNLHMYVTIWMEYVVFLQYTSILLTLWIRNVLYLAPGQHPTSIKFISDNLLNYTLYLAYLRHILDGICHYHMSLSYVCYQPLCYTSDRICHMSVTNLYVALWIQEMSYDIQGKDNIQHPSIFPMICTIGSDATIRTSGGAVGIQKMPVIERSSLL